MRTPYQLRLLLHVNCFVPGGRARQDLYSSGRGAFLLQCPTTTAYHPIVFLPGGPEPAYRGPAPLDVTVGGVKFSTAVNTDSQHSDYIIDGGQIRCQQISGGGSYMTEEDGNQTFMFSFGPLSGIDNIQHGLPSTLLNMDFNGVYTDTMGTHHGH